MNKTTILLVIALIASGCADSTSNSSGKGLMVEEFSISDNTLRPNQEANLKVTLKNYNKNPTTLEEVSIVNEGTLNVGAKNCSSDEIRQARDGLFPQISCSWTVKAPGEEFIEGFESKRTPVKLRLTYTTELENNKPLKVDIKELEDITNSGKTSTSFSNGEISLSAKTETPQSLGSSGVVQVTAQNSGPGNIEGNFSFETTPSDVFKCPDSKSPLINDKAKISCSLEPDKTGTRNMFITTSYKYVKSPNLDIKVVNNQ